MEQRKVVFHFWMAGPNGEQRLFEVDYYHYPNAVGLYSYAKVHMSERPCQCPNRQHLAMAMAAVNN